MSQVSPIPSSAIILAAGKGTRMKSDLPKVVHPVGGRPMVCAVVDACREAGIGRVVVVVGYQQEAVREALKGYRDIEYAVQEEQLGTGHAVRCAAKNFESVRGDVVVLCGDGPLIRAETIRTMLDRHRAIKDGLGAAATLATSVIDDPSGYGRIYRVNGAFRAIVEQKNCTPEQLKIKEVNPSYYCFDAAGLFESLAAVTRNALTGEYYITDVPEMMMKAGKRVEVIEAVPPEDVLSINTPEDLSKVDSIYRARRRASSGSIGMKVIARELKIFTGRSSAALTQRVCDHLGLPVGAARSIFFPDGEVIVKLDEDVRGRDVFVVISTCEPVNDNLMELLIYIDCLRRASAYRITVVIPYFGYARQDRKDEGRVPITAKLVANLITAAGAGRVIALDLHAAQIQGFFDIPVDHLSATPVFIDYFTKHRESLGDLCLVSPDVGNVKVAEGMANYLGGDLAIINKRRLSGSDVTTGNLIGNVKDKTVLMFDDMISTAGTVCEAAKLLMDRGAKQIISAATHPVLVGPAVERLLNSPIHKIVVCNTIPIGQRCDPIRHKLVELSVGPLLGEAITRIHNNQSISALFQKTAGTKR